MDIKSKINLRTGTTMPVLGLGTYQLVANTEDSVARALAFGYRMIDTSGDYGTQTGIGEALFGSGILRSEVYIITKIEETENAYESVRKNLEELKLRYTDLVLIHRPPKEGAGVELWKGLIRAKVEGLALDIGVSNYSIKQIDALIEATDEVPAVNQIEWSPFGWSEEMLRYADEKKMVIMAYSPLTRGNRLGDERLREIAEKYQKTPAQILIRWNLQRGTVPIPKSSDTEHQKENLNVFDFEISPEDMERLDNLNERYSAFGDLPYV